MTTDRAYITFGEFLTRHDLVKEAYVPYYVNWVKAFAQSCGGARKNLTWGSVSAFLSGLASGGKVADWQVRQADDALTVYVTCYLPQVHAIDLTKQSNRYQSPGSAGQRVTRGAVAAFSAALYRKMAASGAYCAHMVAIPGAWNRYRRP